MSRTAFFLLKTTIRDDYDLADAARDVEQMAEAVCIDYMHLENLEETDVSPYIAT